MIPYYEQDGIQLFLGDCRDVLPTLADCSVDSIVTDPPYELGFMGKSWDRSGIAYQVEVWRDCLRVLKHGGHLLAFGGSRTYHRLACAIEDAGFEIRDQIQWLYGSGFPKSLNIQQAINKAERGCPQGTADPLSPNHGKFKSGCSHDNEKGRGFGAGAGAFMAEFSEGRGDDEGEWNGWGTALKPAHEPIVMARKPIEGTVAENVLKHGTGGINVDGCRVGTDTERGDRYNGKPPSANGGNRIFATNQYQIEPWDVPAGRWPANVIHDGSGEVVSLFPETTSGDLSIGHKRGSGVSSWDGGGGIIAQDYGGDSGSAARFFYVAKASKEDREEGLNGLVSIMIQWPKCDTNTIAGVNEVRLLVDTDRLPLRATVECGTQHRSVIAWSMSWFGSELMALYQRECKSTTKMKTSSIIASRILNSLIRYLTNESIAVVKCATANGGSLAGSAESSEKYLLTTNVKTASVLGVESVRLPAQLTISASDARNFHSTVKPTDLMRYLVRLVTPPNGTVLDPFGGSGSTAKACAMEDFKAILIEKELEYCEIAMRRAQLRQRRLMFA